MAEIDELVVRITGDVSGLEGAVAHAQGALAGLTGAQNDNTAAVAKGAKGLEVYKQNMREAKNTLTESRSAHVLAQRTYEANKKSIDQNVTALKAQQQSVKSLIASKQNEIAALEQANKTVNKGSIAYNDNARAIEWTKTELSALEQEHDKIGGSIRSYEAALAGSKKAVDDTAATAKKAAEQYAYYEKNFDAVERQAKASQLQITGKQFQEVGEGIDRATKPLQYAGLALAAGGVAAAKFAVDFEDSFAGVKKTVEGTPEQLEEIRRGIIDLTTTGINGHSAIPKTTTELNELAAAGGQLGIQTENILGFTETMAQLDTATNLHGEAGAQALARFMNVTDTSQKNVDRLGSTVVDLGNNFATTEAEIIDMGLDMGATGHAIGMSTQAVLGYSTALSSMGVDAAAGGSALQRIWMDMQNAVSSGSEELDAFAEISGKSAEEFKQSWGKDADEAFRDFLKGLNESADQVGVLNALGFNNVRDQRALMALAGDKGFAVLTDAINRANKAWDENTALQNEFNAKAETTASKMAIAKNNVVEAGRSLGEVMLPTVVDVTGGIAKMTQGLAKMPDAGKKAVVGTSAVVVGAGAMAKSAASAAKTVGTLRDGWGDLKDIMLEGGAGAKFLKIAGGVGAVGAAVAVTAGAVKFGTYLYERYHEAQINWSEGMAETAETYKKSSTELEGLNKLYSEYKGLQTTIKTSADTSEVEAAKTRIEEIKTILADQYDINVGTEGLENALSTAINLRNTLSETSAIELKNQIVNGRDNFEDTKARVEDLQAQYDAAQKMELAYTEADTAVKTMQTDYDALSESQRGDISYQQQFIDRWNAMADSIGNEKMRANVQGLTADGRDLFALLENGQMGRLNFLNDAQEFTDTMAELKPKIDELTPAMEEYVAAAKDFANGQVGAIAAKSLTGESTVGEFENLKLAIQNADLSLQDYTLQAAEAKSGVTDLGATLKEGGEGLNNLVTSYISAGQQLGMTSMQAAQGAALLKNGFTDMQSAMDAGALDAVQNDMNNLAQSMNLLPDNKHIEITAEGDISLINDATGKIEKIQGENVTVTVNADGSIEILNTATGEMQSLSGLGDVHIGINAEGDIAILDQANQDIATINENGEITVNGDYPGADEIQQALNDKDNVSDKDASLTVKGQYNGRADVAQAISDGQALQNIGDQTVTYTVNYVQNGTPPKENATGTDYFSGGLAMVNDQRGIADPRELIVDRGRAFIPEGRDVILPLSRGAKVYTASQTRAIMSGLGIPRYAEGKQNSDAFTSARDSWTHYTKTHAVTTAQELEKWLELQEQFRDTDKDIEDIEEQIFSLRQKQTKELNDQSAAWIETRNALNDWSDIGDDPVSAFNRVKEHNMAEVEAGRQTWEDYTDTVTRLGKEMYDDRISQSRDWLDHEEKYHDLSANEYIDGLTRMAAYTEEYFSNGLISYREYAEGLAEINDSIIDKEREKLDKQMDESLAWIDDRTYFNDWQNYGDDPISAYDRVKEREYAAMEAGEQSWEEYCEHVAEYGSALYQGRKDQSERWLKEQRDYFGMEAEDYAAGLERMKKTADEYLAAGIIDAREWHEAVTDINHQMWDEAKYLVRHVAFCKII